ncbi:glycosyltransferase [Nonlabens sp.]|uniref:glycosyltransferase n=1 Tax=Nonlabens sp. TaxID=1888209 RepID=UPI001BCAA0C7|nr:glycosyltransferase [Nonlabens sp.]
MKRELHIISFDIPLPANYGGVIDVFYKIKALYQQGIEITLHCYQYSDRLPQEELKQYCKEVYYYRRKLGFCGISSHLPYIVYSRRSKKLLYRLQMTDAPILFEGLHTCYYLNHESLKSRFKIVRCHNIEHEYYKKLAQHSSSTKKLFFQTESDRLKRYESVLENAQVLAPISDEDQIYFKASYTLPKVKKISAFHTDQEVTSLLGNGNYSLFHGSLNVSENDHSARFLVAHIFNDLDHQLIIAGKKPSFELQKLCAKKDNVTLVRDPDRNQLNDLIANAHIHLMHASQKSGLKLKLLKALFSGRHVVANKDMATEKSISDHVVMVNSNTEWKEAVIKLMKQAFDEDLLHQRITTMNEFKNDKSATLLTDTITF